MTSFCVAHASWPIALILKSNFLRGYINPTLTRNSHHQALEEPSIIINLLIPEMDNPPTILVFKEIWGRRYGEKERQDNNMVPKNLCCCYRNPDGSWEIRPMILSCNEPEDYIVHSWQQGHLIRYSTLIPAWPQWKQEGSQCQHCMKFHR